MCENNGETECRRVIIITLLIMPLSLVVCPTCAERAVCGPGARNTSYLHIFLDNVKFPDAWPHQRQFSALRQRVNWNPKGCACGANDWLRQNFYLARSPCGGTGLLPMGLVKTFSRLVRSYMRAKLQSWKRVGSKRSVRKQSGCKQ